MNSDESSTLASLDCCISACAAMGYLKQAVGFAEGDEVFFAEMVRSQFDAQPRLCAQRLELFASESAG